MQNPKVQLSEYLDRLIHKFLNTKSLHLELKRTLDWQTPEKIDALKLSSYFFQLATYSLSRTILVELAMLLSRKEQRSLFDWLTKAREHASSLDPTVYNPEFSEVDREPVAPEDYQEIIDGQLEELEKHDDLIDRIKARRDKVIAHMDKKYFKDPAAVYDDFPLSTEEIDTLFDSVSEILRKHHSLLTGANLNMEIVSGHHVDVVLRYARAHMRARRDRKLLDKGYRPVDYERDEYEK